MTNQYAHSSAIMILTPAGRVTRYFYGIDYPARDVRLGLVEASSEQNRHSHRPGAAVLLPLRSDQRKVRAGDHERVASGGAAHVGALLTFMIVMFRRDFRAAQPQGGTT